MKNFKALMSVTLLLLTVALLNTAPVYGREDVGKSPPSSTVVKATIDQTVYHFDATATILEATYVDAPVTSYAKMNCSAQSHEAIAAVINYAIPAPERSQAVHNDNYLERSFTWYANVPRPPLTALPPDMRCTGYGLSTLTVAPVGNVVTSMSSESFARSRLS
jgi:hypothetical protein